MNTKSIDDLQRFIEQRNTAADKLINPDGTETALGASITGTGNRVMTSPDGIVWTAAWSPSLGLFAAVAESGA